MQSAGIIHKTSHLILNLMVRGLPLPNLYNNKQIQKMQPKKLRDKQLKQFHITDLELCDKDFCIGFISGD